MAALAGLALGHGGTAGLLLEILPAVAIAALLVWAAIKSRGGKGDP